MAVSILKVLVCLLFCLVNFYQEDVRNAVAAKDGDREINIGVILDTDWYGKVAKTAFELAADDVNKENKLPYSSRLVLHFRSSGGDQPGNAVMAASAAVDLLRSQEVVAIIGPQTSQEAGFVVNLCNASKVPMVSFSVTDPLVSAQRYPYFIRLPHSDAVQADAIAALVEYYGWREVVAVYSDNDYGTGMLPFLRESLSKVGCAIAYRWAIPVNLNSTAARAKLSDLKNIQTRVFIVHVTSHLGTILFSEAQKMEMMTRDYVWIITEGFSAVLEDLNESSIASMQGVLGTRTYMPISNQSLDFHRRWKSRFIAENTPEAKRVELNIYGYYAYDAVWIIARALQDFYNPEFNFSLSSDNPNVLFNTQLSNLPVFQQGERLLQLLGNTNFSGLSGQLQVIEGEIAGATYEILNVIGKSYRSVGYWRKGLGLSNSSADIGPLENVTWPGGLTDKPRGWAMPTTSSKMRIAVPVKDGFGGFVRTYQNASGHWLVDSLKPGFVIEMFDAVQINLSYHVPYEYIPYPIGSELPGYYDDILKKVSSKEFDAVVGDFTILAKRSELVDFTQPYFESGLVMVVPIKQTNPSAWTFILPFTGGMWSTTGAFFVFTGIVVWLLEHKFNDTFRGNPKEQVTTFLWFSFSTLFFSQREKVVSSLARGVIIIWLFVVLILQSSYTANLTAILTAKELQPTIQDVESLKSSGKPVGYQAGSFVDDYLVEHLGIERTKLKKYSSPDEYAEALSNETVAAIFDELPYICVFLSKHPAGFTIVGDTYRTGGFGFAFPKGSPLLPDMSTSVLEISESPEAQRIRKAYFNNTDCSNAGSQANSNPRLSMESFWGLFLITGSASALGLLIYLGRLVYTYVHNRLPQEQQQFPSTKHLIWSRLKSFVNYMDEKKASDKSKETSPVRDQNLPETPNFGTSISGPPAEEIPNFGTSISGPPAEESQEDEGYEDTISSASSFRSSSFFSLPEAAWTEYPPSNPNPNTE